MEPDTKEIPQVERRIGSLPDLWERNAVFVANLLSLFFGNVRGTEILRHEVGAIETYGGRLIPILNLVFRGSASGVGRGGDNLLILEDYPDPVLCDYFENVLKLSLPEVEINDHSDYLALQEASLSEKSRRLVDVVKSHPAEWLDGFVTDEALVQLAELAGKKLIASFEGSRQGNNKYLLHQFLISQGLPVFDTLTAKDEGEVEASVHELRRLGYKRGVVKAQVGASGIGMHRLDFVENVSVPEYLFYEGACLVQGWLEEAEGIRFLGSPSVQLFIGEGKLSLFDLTDQILSHSSVHEGNMAPPAYLEEYPGLKEELLSQAEVAAVWLHERGYRGTGSVDFHVVDRRGVCEVRICEINARITGATYPSLLARHFRSEGAWLMRNVRFAKPYPSRTVLDALDEACLLFHPGAASGVLPINFNLTRDGYVIKGQFLAIGADVSDVLYLFRCVKNFQSILWEYDRD